MAARTASSQQKDIARPRAGENRTPLGAVVRCPGNKPGPKIRRRSGPSHHSSNDILINPNNSAYFIMCGDLRRGASKMRGHLRQAGSTGALPLVLLFALALLLSLAPRADAAMVLKDTAAPSNTICSATGPLVEGGCLLDAPVPAKRLRPRRSRPDRTRRRPAGRRRVLGAARRRIDHARAAARRRLAARDGPRRARPDRPAAARGAARPARRGRRRAARRHFTEFRPDGGRRSSARPGPAGRLPASHRRVPRFPAQRDAPPRVRAGPVESAPPQWRRRNALGRHGQTRTARR